MLASQAKVMDENLLDSISEDVDQWKHETLKEIRKSSPKLASTLEESMKG